MAAVESKMDNMDFAKYFEWVYNTPYTGPYGVTFKIYVKEGLMEKYKEGLLKIWTYELPPNSKKSDGPFEDIVNENVVWTQERWSSTEAFKTVWDKYKDDELMKEVMGQIDGVQIAVYKLNEF